MTEEDMVRIANAGYDSYVPNEDPKYLEYIAAEKAKSKAMRDIFLGPLADDSQKNAETYEQDMNQIYGGALSPTPKYLYKDSYDDAKVNFMLGDSIRNPIIPGPAGQSNIPGTPYLSFSDKRVPFVTQRLDQFYMDKNNGRPMTFNNYRKYIDNLDNATWWGNK